MERARLDSRSTTSAACAATASWRTRRSAGRTPRRITAATRPRATQRPNRAGRPQAATRDFVELTEDLSGSPLWNPDLAPTPLARRTWSTYHIAALWIGMSVVITTYTLASGLMQQGMTWWQAMLTILLGNAIVLVPMILNAHAGTKYGVSFPGAVPRQLRREGRERPGDPARARRLRLVRHPDVDRRPGAEHAARRGVAGMGRRCPATSGSRSRSSGCVAGLRSSSTASRASRSSKAGRRRCCSAAARCCSAGRSRAAAGSATSSPSRSRLQTAHVPFWQLFPAALTANVGYWATLSLNIPDFTRYARSQRSQALGQALGLPATMTAFAFIGVAVTSATIVIFGEAIWDPVALIARIGSAAGHHLRRARRAAGAAHDQHGGQRRVAGERLLEPRARAASATSTGGLITAVARHR